MAEKDKGSSGSSGSGKLPKAAPPGQFFGTPVTHFPQYSMASMFPQLPPAGPAQYMNGAWSLPQPGSTPTPPLPPPGGGGGGGNNPLRAQLQGLLKGNPHVPLGTDPAFTQGWGLFGGGAPMPTMKGDYRKVFQGYNWS